MARRRQAEVFSMSFLDVMSCGLGAVVLLYTIISAQAGIARIKENEDLNAEANRLEQQVLEGYKRLAELRNAMASTDEEKVRAEGLARQVMEKLALTQEELAKYEYDTLARRESLERLKADLKSLEEDTRRLKAAAERVQTGTQVRSVAGDGDRQYLTGLKVGGKNVLILLDASASMLDETLVNIIRMRNMSADRKLRSEKWQQAIGTVDWISAQLPPESQFQLYAFNTAVWPLVEGSGGRWLAAKDSKLMSEALKALRRFVADPATGSRHNRGCAIDLSLHDLETGLEVSMPSGYDEFSERARPDYTGGTPEQRAARDLLRRTMEAEGFTVNDDEWWHFDHRDWQSYRIGTAMFKDLPRAN